MKIKAVKKFINKFICWVLFLQMINISINPPDLKHFNYISITHKEDLSINEIESIYEWISEVIFEKNVHEKDESDIHTISKTFNLYFFPLISNELLIPYFLLKHSSYYQNNFSVLYAEPVFPPPKEV